MSPVKIEIRLLSGSLYELANQIRGILLAVAPYSPISLSLFLFHGSTDTWLAVLLICLAFHHLQPYWAHFRVELCFLLL